MTEKEDELVQPKLNIKKSDGDSTPPDLEPTYRSGGLNPDGILWIKIGR